FFKLPQSRLEPPLFDRAGLGVQLFRLPPHRGRARAPFARENGEGCQPHPYHTLRRIQIGAPGRRNTEVSKMHEGQAPKLLIIDDDAHLRESLAEVLDLDGFECHQAGSAKEGIEKAQKLSPKVVLMDIQLPDSSGFQICTTLRRASKEMILIMM